MQLIVTHRMTIRLHYAFSLLGRPHLAKISYDASFSSCFSAWYEALDGPALQGSCSMYPAQGFPQLSGLDQVLALTPALRSGVGSFRGLRWELDQNSPAFR